mgnify:FL=1
MKQYTKEDLKEIKMLLNDYVVQNDFDFIYNNLHLIGYTCEAIRKISKPFAKSMNNSDIEYKNFPVYTGKFRLDIVRKYLKEHQIDLDVDDLFNRGIICCNCNTYPDEIAKERIYKPYTGGRCQSYLDEHRVELLVPNTGYISDSAVLVHELSHYREEEYKNYTTASREIFTEALAYTEEFIFWKDNEKEFTEIECFIRNFLCGLTNLAIKMESIIAIIIVFVNTGDIDQEAYKLYFGTDENYEEDLQELLDVINSSSFKLLENIRYVIALILFPYLYYSCLQDPNFMNKIQELHKLILNENVLTCLDYIGINTISFEEIDKISEFLKLLYSEHFTATITKEQTKTLD